MKTTILIITACLSLAACATVNDTYAPDGKKAYTLNCSGTGRGWDKCYSAAGKLCGERGYKVLDRSDEDTSSIGGGSGSSIGGSSAGFSGGSSSGFFGVKTNERSMLVECK